MHCVKFVTQCNIWSNLYYTKNENSIALKILYRAQNKMLCVKFVTNVTFGPIYIDLTENKFSNIKFFITVFLVTETSLLIC